MVIKLLLAACILAAPASVYMQSAGRIADDDSIPPVSAPDGASANPGKAEPAETSATTPDAGVERKVSTPVPVSEDIIEDSPTKIGEGYVRPDAKKRFRNYLKNIGSPLALSYYAGTAELLTWRNSPKEWGDHGDGYARRLGNVASKHVIMSTTTYALDEALKLDSTFYRSRDRSVTARMRNSLFSAVTARNSRGKRVIGWPAITGGLVSEVVSSTVWYPSRYDAEHGLKGGAIALGVTAGLNLIKEFIWKP